MLNHHEADAIIEVLVRDKEMDDVLKYGIVGKLMVLKYAKDNEQF